MRKALTYIAVTCMTFCLLLTGCNAPKTAEDSSQQDSADTQPNNVTDDKEAQMTLHMTIDETDVDVAWEENQSVEALRALCQSGPLTITMSRYGGFEQVGPIGQRLPSSDSQITTQAGDIVLYSGDQIVVFYGSNSWAYTKLGHITDKSNQELTELLSNGDVTITITAEQ